MLNEKFPQVDLLRIMHFGAMVVRQTKEYHKNATDGPNDEKLTVNHVFIGGVNPHIINTSVLEVSTVFLYNFTHRSKKKIR